MARNRSTALIGVGAAVFVVGAALTFLLVRDDGDEKKVSASAPAAQSAVQTAAPAAAAPTAATVDVPDGKEAVAVQVPTVPGLGGYAKIGDRVNVYGTFKDRQPNSTAKGAPVAKLVIPDADVLAVTGPAVGAEVGNTTYLLAVNPGGAEQVIYLASFEGIWLSLTPESAPAITGTPGRNAQNIA